MMTLGQRLRRARLAMGLSQAEVARRGRTSQSAIARYENGSVEPEPATFGRILTAIGYTPGLALRSYRSELIAIAADHKATNVRVFGSTARHEDNPLSDLDLLVTFRPGASLFDLVGLIEALEERLGISVDVLSDRTLERRQVSIQRDAVHV